MFQSLDLFVVSCLFLTVLSQQGQILKPQNVSLLWIEDFQLQVTWAPPQHSVENCTYKLFYNTLKEHSKENYSSKTPQWKGHVTMDGGYLNLAVQTVCNGTSSEPAVVIENYPELVKNLECYIYSPTRSCCSWPLDRPAPDLRFFYALRNEDFSASVNDEPLPLIAQECSSYNYTDGIRTGCDLETKVDQVMYILLNGTVNNTLARNTFEKWLRDDVRLPALDWTVTNTGDKFYINWTLPIIKDDWKFIIRVNECGSIKNNTYSNGETSAVLNVISHCPYDMDIKAERKAVTDRGGTQWSKPYHFDAGKNPTDWLYAAVIAPLMIAGLAVLVFVCCRKNKEIIFPNIPGPSDLLSDIPDNNNKSSFYDLVVPLKEEEICKITLVSDPDPQHNNPDL